MKNKLWLLAAPLFACGTNETSVQPASDLKVEEQANELDSDNISLYHSDSCSSELIALIGEKTDCSRLNISTSVWAIKVNGVCFDTTDMPFKTACKAFKAASDPAATVLHHSDSCRNEAVAFVNEKTNCDDVGVTTSVWGVAREGKCEDVADQPFVQACKSFQTPAVEGGVQIYHSDSCSSELLATIGEKTDCATLSNSRSAWGVKIDGVCRDIADQPLQTACRAFKAADDPGATALYHSDACSTELVAMVNEKTDCRAVGVTTSVWGVSYDKQCQDITDISFVDACERFKGAGSTSGDGVELFHSDSCSGSLLTTLDERTDCDSLTNMSTVWGISANEQCIDVPDRTAVAACYTLARAASPDATVFYHSDNCSGQVLVYADEKSDCRKIAPHVRSSVWGVRIKGECQDIRDTDFASACAAFLPGSAPQPQPK